MQTFKETGIKPGATYWALEYIAVKDDRATNWCLKSSNKWTMKYMIDFSCDVS